VANQRGLTKKQALKATEILPAKQQAGTAAKAQAAGGAETALIVKPPLGQTSILKKQIVERMLQDPANSGRLIQAWLREDA